jgi:hypothetical protein
MTMRPMMTVFLTLLAVLGISPAWAQEAGHASEIDLILPDLSQVMMMGTNGRTLLLGGLVVCLIGLGLRPVDLHPVARHAGPQVDARDQRADLRDLQDVSDHAGQVHPRPRAVHRHGHGRLLLAAARHAAFTGWRSSSSSA